MNAIPGELPSHIREADKRSDKAVAKIDEAIARKRGGKASRLERAADAIEAAALPLVVSEAGDVVASELSPIAHVVEPIIPRSVVTLLGGHGGMGKSTLALTIAAHVAAGMPWNGLCVAQGRVLVVTLEDTANLMRWRLRAIQRAYGLSTQAIAHGVLIADATDADDTALAVEAFGDDSVLRVVPTDAMRQLETIAQGCALIVIDNASDAADLDENNRRRVRQFMRLFARLARDNDAGVLVLAHVDKASAKHGANGNSYSGSTAWHNSARSRLALVEDNGHPLLIHEKANLGPKAEPVRLRFNDDGALIPHDGQPNEAAALLASGDADAVLAAMAKAQAVGEPISASHTGPANAHVTLSTFGLPDFLLGGAGRGRFWRAVESLLADGRAMVETVRTEQRKERRRIVLCANAPMRQSPVPPIEPAHSVRAGFSYAPKSEPAQTGATGARHSCPHCDGEGCAHCAGLN